MDNNNAGYLVDEGNNVTSKKKQEAIDTHEKFMREASKQMVDNLTTIRKDVKSILSWVLLFGILTILGLIVGGCNLIMSF